MNSSKSVMDVLVQIRKDKGLRQVDVAKSLGIGQPAVSELESGVTSPRLDTLARYAEALGLTLSISLEEDAEIGMGKK